MRAEPPAELVALLERLRLATAAQVAGVAGRVRLLANDLPLFASIWVDALAQARAITRYQAAEINAGRADGLAVGPFVLCSPALSLGYAEVYRAREAATGRSVDLLVAGAPSPTCSDAASFAALIARMAALDNRRIALPEHTGAAGHRIWIAYPPNSAATARDLVLHTGRLRGAVVLEIARQMAAALAELEAAAIVHGDVSPTAVSIGSGKVQLARAGVRGILRPVEGFDAPLLPPDGYDNLAPERVADDSAPTAASDLYACGCVWWQLLTGRPPLAGGTSAGKLRAVRAAKIVDVRRFAPDAPRELVAAIAACTQPAPGDRPASFAALVELLGASTAAGRRALERAYAGSAGKRGLAATARAVVRSREAPAWLATIAGCAAVIAAVSWPLWRQQNSPRIDPKAARVSLAETSRAAQSAPALPSAPTAPLAGDPWPGASRDRERPITPADRSISEQRVERADYLERAGNAAAGRPPPLLLPGGKVTFWNPADFPLRAGQTVTGRPNERPLIAAAPGGIVVAAEGVRFENIDFIWRQSPDAAIDPERLAIVDLRAARASFSGCTFQAAPSEGSDLPAAILWNGPRRSELPPAGRLQLRGCVFRGVASGIDCRRATPLALKITDTLYLGSGPLVRLDHVPRADEPIDFELAHATLRGAAALIGFQARNVAGLPLDALGIINVTTNDCVLSPRRGGAIVLFATPDRPAALAKTFQWSGQGSLVTSQARVGAWLKPDDAARATEVDVPVDGLASSAVDFAGPIGGSSSASRITRWQAPVESVDPPGIPDGLPNLPPLPSWSVRFSVRAAR